MGLSSVRFPYIVVLKNQSVKLFNYFGLLLNLTSCIFFIKEFAFAENKNFFLLAGIALVLGVIIWNLIRAKKGKRVYYDRAFLISALLWVKMPYMEWLFIAFILLALLDFQVKFPLEIGFSENQVVFNSLLKKKYSWAKVNNVVLKDGMLTIDFHNNRILQREVEDDIDEEDVSEEEFNEYCREQLMKQKADSKNEK